MDFILNGSPLTDLVRLANESGFFFLPSTEPIVWLLPVLWGWKVLVLIGDHSGLSLVWVSWLYAQEWIILKNICECGHAGSWNWMADWAQSWPGVILNELGDSRSWDQLPSLLIFNCGALSHQILINHSIFFLLPIKRYRWKSMKNKTKQNKAIYSSTGMHVIYIFSPAFMVALPLCQHRPAVLRAAMTHDCRSRLSSVVGFPWPGVAYLIKIGPLETIIRVMPIGPLVIVIRAMPIGPLVIVIRAMPIGPLVRVMRVMPIGPLVSHKSHAHWSISKSHKSHVHQSISESHKSYAHWSPCPLVH